MSTPPLLAARGGKAARMEAAAAEAAPPGLGSETAETLL